MYGLGRGVPIDIEKDDPDDKLVMILSGLYRSGATGSNDVTEGWFASNIHKDLVSICNKFDDKKWFAKGQHCFCIYYACAILNAMASVSESGALRVANEPNIISTLVSLWQGNILSWIESRCAVKCIFGMIQAAPQLLTRFINNDVGVDIFKLAVIQYGQCLFDTIKTWAVLPSMMEPQYVADMMCIIKNKNPWNTGDDELREIALDLAVEWTGLNASILAAIGRELRNLREDKQVELDKQKIVNSFVNEIDVWTIERACCLDLCWALAKDVQDLDQLRDSFIDCIIYLSHDENFCKKLAECSNVIKWITIRLRCMNTLDLRLDLIINNMLKFDLIENKYYRDLANSLLPILECDRKMRNIKHVDCFVQIMGLFQSVVSSLKLIFSVATQIEYVDVERADKYKCLICNQLLQNPHKMKNCKHRYCYLCIVRRWPTQPGSKMRKCIAQNCGSEEFDFKAFEKVDYSALNAIKSLKIKTKFPFKSRDEFVGTMQELWEEVKSHGDSINAKKILSDDQFEYFVDYMIKEHSITKAKHLQRRRIAANKKEEGNIYFKENSFESAVKCYREALRLCPNQYHNDRVVYFSNMALAYMKSGDYVNAYFSCQSGLAFNDYVKLAHTLVKCYENLQMTSIFSAVDGEVSETSYYSDSTLFKVEKFNFEQKTFSRVKNSLLQSFPTWYAYLTVRSQLGLDPYKEKEMSPQETANLEARVDHFLHSDPTVRMVQQQLPELLEEVQFVQYFFTKAFCQYLSFAKEYENIQRHLYRFVFDLVANKPHAQEDTTVILRKLQASFGMNKYLTKMRTDAAKQCYLIYGFYRRNEISSDTLATLPSEMINIIGEYVFNESIFDFDRIGKDEYLISRLVGANSSKLSTYTDWTQGHNQTIKFKDDQDASRNNWQDIEFSNDENCARRFLKLI